MIRNKKFITKKFIVRIIIISWSWETAEAPFSCRVFAQFLVWLFLLTVSLQRCLVYIKPQLKRLQRSFALDFKLKWQWLAYPKNMFSISLSFRTVTEKFLPFRKGKVVTSHHAWLGCNWIESEWRHEKLVACQNDILSRKQTFSSWCKPFRFTSLTS